MPNQPATQSKGEVNDPFAAPGIGATSANPAITAIKGQSSDRIKTINRDRACIMLS